MSVNAGRRRLLTLARKRSILTAGEAAKAGIHRQVLTRLVREGALERVERGRYRLPSRPISEHHGLVLAASAVPHGVICLLSALSFHGIGTQLPSRVWIAVRGRTRRPALRHPPLHVVRFSGPSFSEGIETQKIEGHTVRIYGVAKTVADAFKYRNKIGLDVALEALREAWRERRFTMNEIDDFARVCRVERVIKPYLESLVT